MRIEYPNNKTCTYPNFRFANYKNTVKKKVKQKPVIQTEVKKWNNTSVPTA